MEPVALKPIITRDIREFPADRIDLKEFPWAARYKSMKEAYAKEMYAITVGPDVVGAMLLEFKEEPELIFFEVVPRWRGQGVGQASLEVLFDMLRRGNHDRLVVQTGRPEIYTGMGFQFTVVDHGHIAISLHAPRPDIIVNSRSTVCFVYSPNYLDHDDPLHPEHNGRVAYTMTRLRKEMLLKGANVFAPRMATEEDILAIHSRELLEQVKLCSRESIPVTRDTPAGPHSFDDACLSLGGALMAAELIEQHSQVFVLCRPPGHHAFRDRAGGFCFFNNMAALAVLLWKRGYKPMVIDWDVHHGNGTQDLLYRLPIMYVSFHQKYLYPHTGAENEIGEAEGLGYNRNFPLPIGMKDREYMEVFNGIRPIVADVKPDVILISAGQDGHFQDRHSGLKLTSEAYYLMGSLVGEVAKDHCDGRVILLMEGGYHLQANAESLGRAIAGIRETTGSMPNA